MATHSGILAWKIPWTEEPGRLKSMESQTVRHNCATNTFTFLGGSEIKHLSANAGIARDSGLIPGSGRSPGGGNANPLQYSCLENPTDRRAWRGSVRGVEESHTTERLSIAAFTLQPQLSSFSRAYTVFLRNLKYLPSDPLQKVYRKYNNDLLFLPIPWLAGLS